MMTQARSGPAVDLLRSLIALNTVTAVLDVYVGRGLDQLPFCAVSQEDMVGCLRSADAKDSR